MRALKWMFATALVVLTLAGHGLFAAVPTTMPYHGYLTDNAGRPANGTFSVVFALYDVPAGGSALWSETQPTLNIVAGVVSTDLGLTVPLTDALFGDPLYLGVKVGTDAEMAPRLRFGSVPFARISGGVSCGSGITNCSGVCTNLTADPAHCGSCTNACDAGADCTSGACTCSGAICPIGTRCVSGTCVP